MRLRHVGARNNIAPNPNRQAVHASGRVGNGSCASARNARPATDRVSFLLAAAVALVIAVSPAPCSAESRSVLRRLPSNIPCTNAAAVAYSPAHDATFVTCREGILMLQHDK